MLNKKFMVLAIFFIALVAISAVGAAEDTGDVASIESDTQTNEITKDISTGEMQGDALEASANDESENALAASDDGQVLTGGSNCFVNGSYTGDNEWGTEDNPYKSLKNALYDKEGQSIREDGDIIHIAAGTYSGEANIGLIIDKKLTLQSWGPGQVIFDAQNECGILTIEADEFNVTEITFTNAFNTYFGGALSFTNGLKNSHIGGAFIENSAPIGGAIYVNGDVENSLISAWFCNNTASAFTEGGSDFEYLMGSGGAIFVFGNIKDSFIDGDFTHNVADMFGGAIFAMEGIISTNLTSSDFKINSALLGGAIYAPFMIHDNIKGDYVNNTALAGGAIFTNVVNNTKIDSNFTNNTVDSALASDYPEIINENLGYLSEYLDPQIVESVQQFMEGYSVNPCLGGAISIVGILENSNIAGEFTNNLGAELGGAVCALGLVNRSDISSQFSLNSAELGGALWLQVVEYSNIAGYFMYNSAVQGGAICIGEVLEDSNVSGYFANNTAKVGGAINAPCLFYSNVSGYFANNTAGMGGAIFAFSMDNTEILANFVNNVAKSEEELSMEDYGIVDYSGQGGFGGALCVIGTMQNVVFTGDFVKNHAIEGGAIFADSVKMESTRSGPVPMTNNAFNSNFVGNVAYKGAAIFISATSLQNKFNSNFINNYALEDGIIYLNNVSVEDSIFHCLFMNNTATISVIHIENAEGTNITNNIFLNPLRAYDISHNGGSDSKLSVNDNWFGHNATNYKVFPKINGTVECNTWLFLSAAANPTSVSYLGNSNIVFNLFVYNKVTGSSNKKFDSSLLEPVNLTITSTNGKVNKNVVYFGDVVKFSSNGKKGSVTALIGNAFDTVVISCLPRISSNDLEMDYLGNNYKIQVFDEDGNPVVGEIVKINVHTITYPIKTDKNGYATLPIRLMPNTYVITSTYKGATNKNTLKVKNTLKAEKSFKVKMSDTKFVLKATLKWSNGKAIVGKKVSFKVKGKKFTVKTNKNGIAKIKLSVKIVNQKILKLTFKKKNVLLKVGKKYNMKVIYRNETVKSKVIVNK
ncbi:hypothetical protein [Methanobrevibacter sp.]|uniref:hypothetical protein n=1 Tax=Methanobrevibacter sp. TaxID=66852 RepID=UPI0025DCFAB8|nr:hypothetical protein [Methanobrevibacter sp.]MBR4448041.1 hypothetical protein [Methanobrevibacter sp.]